MNLSKSSVSAVLVLSLTMSYASGQPARIDRHTLVTRHNVTLTRFDGDRPIQVGNGEFAFGMDITGLQTFAPFNTMSHWGWSSLPLPPGVQLEDYHEQVVETHGRPIRYPLPDPNHPAVSAWLAGNPHAIDLGRIGLVLLKKDGTKATVADIQNPHQTLDLWNGLVTSNFEIEGESVQVTTACHPSVDSISARIESPLIKQRRISVFLDVPGDDGAQFANFVGDWSDPADLEEIQPGHPGRAEFFRRLNSSSYHIGLTWQGAATMHHGDDRPTAQLQITRALYGARDKWLDVTAKLSAAVQNGRLAVKVTNSLGPDPIVGVGKTLKVEYVLAGKRRLAEAHENERLAIPPFADSHEVTLQPAADSNTFSFSCAFSTKPVKVPNAAITFAACRKDWPAFWNSGGAIDLSGSKDPRWSELERRIVLSQYLMKVNEAGSLPPQESGLVNNGWFGRFHMEMLWWHATHWALWNRWPELDRSLSIYKKLLPSARKRATSEGYLGARWPKCIGPNFVEWPHEIHSWLIWQQPHPIFFAELDYRAHPTRATLEKWAPVVEATADFLASYAFLDPQTGRYVLGPPLAPVSENTDFRSTTNPTFELGYWRYGLRTAQLWRQRLGLNPQPIWSKVLKGLAPLPVQDGVYVLHEDVKDMWTKFNFEHPALTGAFGLLPGDGVDRVTMRRTLDKVLATWDFNHTWGWDFPMLAMCAARLGEPEQAIDFLLTHSGGFQFDERGLATGGPFPYFPANGGLLYAIAMMAAGWDGAPKRNAPGFPNNGQWSVRYENLSVAP